MLTKNKNFTNNIETDLNISPLDYDIYNLINNEYNCLDLNICKIPKNVYPQLWIENLLNIYTKVYNLSRKQKQILEKTFFNLYEESGVFVPEWREVAHERSDTITMKNVYKTTHQFKLDLEDPVK